MLWELVSENSESCSKRCGRREIMITENVSWSKGGNRSENCEVEFEKEISAQEMRGKEGKIKGWLR
jgi:hypothetical protein